MTDENKKTITLEPHKPHIPTREEFHRYAMPKLNESDFCTDYPSKTPGGVVDRIASSIRWTEKLFTSSMHKWRYENLDSSY